MVEASDGLDVWHAPDRGEPGNRLASLRPGARDTLRLEAAMPLYGHELDEIDRPADGRPVVRGQTQSGRLHRQRRARGGQSGGHPQSTASDSVFAGKRIAREGAAVFLAGREVGHVTSGTFSPTLEKPIAMAYVDSEAAQPRPGGRSRHPRQARTGDARRPAVLQARLIQQVAVPVGRAASLPFEFKHTPCRASWQLTLRSSGPSPLVAGRRKPRKPRKSLAERRARRENKDRENRGGVSPRSFFSSSASSAPLREILACPMNEKGRVHPQISQISRAANASMGD